MPLVFSFGCAAAGTPLEGARLQIEDVPVTVWCGACAAQRTLASVMPRRCPECGAATPDLVRGDEPELVALEVVDVPAR